MAYASRRALVCEAVWVGLREPVVVEAREAESGAVEFSVEVVMGCVLVSEGGGGWAAAAVVKADEARSAHSALKRTKITYNSRRL